MCSHTSPEHTPTLCESRDASWSVRISTLFWVGIACCVIADACDSARTGLDDPEVVGTACSSLYCRRERLRKEGRLCCVEPGKRVAVLCVALLQARAAAQGRQAADWQGQGGGGAAGARARADAEEGGGAGWVNRGGGRLC